MKGRLSLHVALVALAAVVVGCLFLREPGFGDDFTYWSYAFDLHERGLWAAKQQQSFHALRWPVWGVCWLLQGIAGPGPFSYYGAPVLYLVAGALAAFALGRLVSGRMAFAWACALLFLFHPLLDTVCHRPMPDLSEGVWAAGAMLAWWQLTQSRSRGASLGWAALLGLLVYLAESNRLTGIFIAPVLAVCTFFFARRAFGWLVLAGVVAAGCYAVEAWFYHGLFGDWLHNLHANLKGKGKKGTEAIPLLTMPFRFLDTLTDETRLSYLYAAGALLGLIFAWRRPAPAPEADAPAGRMPLRIVATWFVTLYLLYACAPQSISPWRPVVRDADRFLATMAIPMAVLAAAGLSWLLELLRARERRWGAWIGQRPVLAGLVGVAVLAAVSTREWVNFGSMPEMRRYLRSLPAGTAVFTHTAMRHFTWLVDPQSAARLQWKATDDILTPRPQTEALAAQASELWYIRKLVWLNTRKRLEDKAVPTQAALPSYFDHPHEQWALARLLAKGDTPDLVFYRRRPAGQPAPPVLSAEAPIWGGLLPALPLEWRAPEGKKEERTVQAHWPVPPEVRGQAVRLELEAASAQVQAFSVTLRFSTTQATGPAWLASLRKRLSRMKLADDPALLTEYVLKPYLYPGGGKEFFVLSIPTGAEECAVQVKFARDAKAVRFSAFHASFERELAAP